jgi:predicted Rossmann fold flavoprotein
MANFITVVIGGGAAGICAAISAARQGNAVVLCEKTGQLGKKILVSGNGRCNLLNEDFNESYFNTAARPLVKSILSQFGKKEILLFFKELGLLTCSKDGRIFPVTNQAESVVHVLEMELKRLAVSVEYNFNCTGITSTKNGLLVTSAVRENIDCHKIILTGGGKTYPVFGADGSAYEIARQLGHTIVEPVPAVVPLVIKDNLCFLLQGQRITASARSVIDGNLSEPAGGELLFTKYGLSGTCILDISEPVSIALNRQKQTKVYISIDFIPFMDNVQLENELEKRQKAGWLNEEMLTGILPAKMCSVFKDIFGKNNMDKAVKSLKDWRFEVSGTRGWNEAEFTSGGVNVNETKASTLESKLKMGVYLAGEILDVNGRRGGYNLGWAWASGLTAGQTN